MGQLEGPRHYLLLDSQPPCLRNMHDQISHERSLGLRPTGGEATATHRGSCRLEHESVTLYLDSYRNLFDICANHI